MRHSLSLRLFRALRDQGASVIGHDVLAVDEARELEPELETSASVEEAMVDADVVVALNSEPSYGIIDWTIVGESTHPPYVVDTRSILDSAALKAANISFDVLGSTG